MDRYDIYKSLVSLGLVMHFIIYWRHRRKIYIWARQNGYVVYRVVSEGVVFWVLVCLLGLFIPVYIVAKLIGSWLRQSWHITLMDDDGGIRTGRVYFGKSEHLGDDVDKGMEVRWL